MMPLQKSAAAYKLQGRQEFQGLQISIENRKGGVRRWFDPHGKEKGSTKMHWAYGYIRGTKGTDGDHVDVYVGPNPQATHAFIVNQMKKPEGDIKKDGKAWTKFDEQKVMLGWDTAAEAEAAYRKQYDDPRFFGSIKPMDMAQFKEKVMAKANHGKKVAQFLRNPNDPLHVPPTERKKMLKTAHTYAAMKLAGFEVTVAELRVTPAKLASVRRAPTPVVVPRVVETSKVASARWAELEKIAQEVIPDFEYMTEAEKRAGIGSLINMGGRAIGGLARGGAKALSGAKNMLSAGARTAKAGGNLLARGRDAAIAGKAQMGHQLKAGLGGRTVGKMESLGVGDGAVHAANSRRLKSRLSKQNPVDQAMTRANAGVKPAAPAPTPVAQLNQAEAGLPPAPIAKAPTRPLATQTPQAGAPAAGAAPAPTPTATPAAAPAPAPAPAAAAKGTASNAPQASAPAKGGKKGTKDKVETKTKGEGAVEKKPFMSTGTKAMLGVGALGAAGTAAYVGKGVVDAGVNLTTQRHSRPYGWSPVRGQGRAF